MNRPLWNTIFAIVVSAGLGAGSVAFAQEPAAPPPGGPAPGPCKDDVTKLCAGIAPGGGRLLKCLHQHEAELSAACKAAMPPGRKAGAPPAAATPGAPPPPPAAVAPGKPDATSTPGARGPKGRPTEWGPMMSMRRSCAAEIAKSCKDVKPGHGRIATCLNDHPQDLKPACKTAVDQMMGQLNARMETHKACEPDAERLCGDATPGTGRLAVCLGEHTAELSPDCKKHITKMKAEWGKAALATDKPKGPAATATPASAPPPPAPAAGSKPATPPPPPPPPPAK